MKLSDYVPRWARQRGKDRELGLYLTAYSDRTVPWDPNATGNPYHFLNDDNSLVKLAIPTPGLWMVGWGGFVRSQSGNSNFEADVYVVQGESGDGNTIAIGSALTDTGGDMWVQALSPFVVDDPLEIAAYVYSNDGTNHVQAWPSGSPSPGYFRMPLLFAWRF